jgi:hypothetical protein
LKILPDDQATHAQVEQGAVYIFADDGRLSRYA